MSSVTEEELQEKAVAPRVTQADVEAFVKSVSYTTVGLVTFAVIVGQNGFSFTGESACAAPENFNREIGERLAYGQAFNKIWSYLGFELRTKLDLIEKAPGPKNILWTNQVQTYVGTKVIHAAPLNRRDYNVFKGWALPEGENGDDEGYIVEYSDSDGYVSWSPKDVFERAYSLGSKPKAETWATRLVAEWREVKDRLTKLVIFLGSPEFYQLPKEEQVDLWAQSEAMEKYAVILTNRMLRNNLIKE